MHAFSPFFFSRASEVISCLDRVHQLKKQEVKPSSLYLKLILEQSGYFSTKMTADKDIKQHLPLVSYPGRDRSKRKGGREWGEITCVKGKGKMSRERRENEGERDRYIDR